MEDIEKKVHSHLEQVRAFRRSGDYQSAKEQLQLAISICPVDRHDLMGHVHAMEGQLFRDEGNIQTGLESYKKAIKSFRQTNDLLKVAHALRHLAEMNGEIGDLEVARNDFEACKKIYEGEIEVSKMDLANFYRAYALFLEKDGGAEPIAADFWEKARSIYEEFGIEEGVKECESHLT